MTVKVTIECDAACSHEEEINVYHPADAETKYYELEGKGWLIDLNQEGYDYCPKCAPIVKAELEEEANDTDE